MEGKEEEEREVVDKEGGVGVLHMHVNRNTQTHHSLHRATTMQSNLPRIRVLIHHKACYDMFLCRVYPEVGVLEMVGEVGVLETVGEELKVLKMYYFDYNPGNFQRDRKMCFGLPMIRIRHLQTIYNYPRLV